MPDRTDLPDSLAGLARRNALRIRHESFGDDAGRLVAAIERVLAAASAAVTNGANSARSPGSAPAGGADVKEGSETERNDPARAARLLGDAEHIANSLTSDYAKASALSGVAAAAAATDPGRAARLLGDAERIANSITRKLEKAEALRDVAAAVAATDPGRAEHIANSITDEYTKASALIGVARTLSA